MPEPILISLDARKRVSLTKFNLVSDLYSVERLDDGTIVMTPVEIVPKKVDNVPVTP